MAREIARGDIWLFSFDAPNKRRPVLVLSRQVALEVMNTAIVAAITSTIRGLPSEVVLGPNEGLKNESAVSLDNIFTVPQQALKQWVGSVSEPLMEQVCAAIAIALSCRQKH